MYKDDKDGWRWSNSEDQMVLKGSGKNYFMLDFRIKTSSRTKKNMKQTIRQYVIKMCKNNNFDVYKKVDLDFAIDIKMSETDYYGQDVDNFQKIVFDALQKDNNNNNKDKDPLWNYLFENDARICRILVWKSIKKKYTDKLFNWNDIKRKNNEKQRLKEFPELENFLVVKLGCNWANTSKIEKIDDMTVKVFGKYNLYFKVDNETDKVTLKMGHKTYEFKTESNGRDVYFDSGIDTISTTISFRIHDPSKPMDMIPLYKLSKFGMIS